MTVATVWSAGALDVTTIGAGTPVGYLHGFVASGSARPFAEEMSRHGFGVTAPNLPGFGATATTADLRNVHDWVWALSEIVDLVGLAGRPVVASSIGAMLALELAAVRPEAFSSLVLVAPLGLWRDDEPVTDPFATTLGNQRALLTNDVSVTADFFDDDPLRSAHDAVEANVRRYTARTAAASLVWPIPDFGLAQRIHRVTCPVTLVWGSDDRIVPPRYADLFAEHLCDLRAVHVVEGAGHLAELDAPTQVAAIAKEALVRV